MQKKINIIVIGAGPAGVFAAIRAAELNPHARITILEAGTEALKKVLLSGGGRCNLTHEPQADVLDFAANYPRGLRELRGPLSHFGPEETIEWFEERRIKLKTEKDGRIFPESNKAQTIADFLLLQAKDAGIKIKFKSEVSGIKTIDKKFRVMVNGGGSFDCDRVLLSGGGNKSAMELVQSLNHTIEEPVPALFGLKSKAREIDELAGTAVQNVGLWVEGTKFKISGPVLITHTGLSGPAILKLSSMSARFLAQNNYKAGLKINWLGNSNTETVKNKISNARKTCAARQVFNSCPFHGIASRLWQRLCFIAGIRKDSRWSSLNSEQINALAQALSASSIKINGKDPKGQEFVTCGGVRLKEIDMRTMESKIVKNLFFAGEIMDIDGFTGGFNLQNAWTSGYIAGTALAD